MDTKTTESSKEQKPTDNSQEQNQSLTKSPSKANRKKKSNTSTKKVLTRKEKMEALRKANQALLKALELRSQREGDANNAESDF